MYQRLRTLVRRKCAAAKLGFAFHGTTRTEFPKSVLLTGKNIALSAPDEGGCFFDVINVWLDDDYGLRSVYAAPRTVLDAGANVGIFSLWAAHNFQGAMIHAYEPNPRIYPYLQSNLSQVSVKTFSSGLGSCCGFADIVDSGESRTAATHLSIDGKIKIDSLSEAIDRLGGTVDLMKIDCEGVEWDLFHDKSSIRRAKEIRMEYHLPNGKTLGDFKQIVDDIGFSIVRLLPNSGFGVAWLLRKD
jgi:FkbM family methyltransferase